MEARYATGLTVRHRVVFPGAVEQSTMLWIAVRTRQEIALTCESGEWVPLPSPRVSEAKDLVRKECPSERFYIAEEDVWLNVKREECQKLTVVRTEKEEGGAGKVGVEELKDCRGIYEKNSKLMEVMFRFAKVLAKEINKASSIRAKPQVSRGVSDKVLPKTWIEQFKYFASECGSLDLVMILREYLSGVALVWYDSTMASLGTSSPRSDKESLQASPNGI